MKTRLELYIKDKQGEPDRKTAEGLGCRRKYGRKTFIDREKCDGCGKCRDRSGCPAIWSRGFRAGIDQGSCTGCGYCIELCERGAICRK